MDLATVCGKYFHKTGNLENLVISDEINACTIQIEAEYDGKKEPWYLLFKNETHNHPTEIEPFGGASTCLGGAIRDPLSGRSFVFQAMRLTGAADVLEPVDKTLPGNCLKKPLQNRLQTDIHLTVTKLVLQQQWFLKSMMKATKQKEWKLVSLPEPFL
jgi:phosphoribosylformylglycinamidine synthase